MRKITKAEKIRRIVLEDVSPECVRAFILSIMKLDPSWKPVLRAHNKYVIRLAKRFRNVPHSVEVEAKEAGMTLGCKLIRSEVGCSLREAFWHYQYLTKGITPWYVEEEHLAYCSFMGI